MTLRTLCVTLLLSTLPIAGCGTVTNLVKIPPAEGGKTPFGGVRQDVFCMNNTGSGEPGPGTCARFGPEQHPQEVRQLLCAADLPFSFVGDVVTWPYAAAYTFINQPVPTPPVIQAPDSPAPQGTAVVRPQNSPAPLGTAVVQPQTSPAEPLSEPKKLP